MDSSCNHLQEMNKKTTNDPGNYEEQTPQLCANDCGFYGTKSFKNLCSKCFKKKNLQEKEKVENRNILSTINEDAASDDEKTGHKVMCSCCNKKIRGMMIYKCRCGGRFCTKHRYPEEHACQFDFKNLGRIDLTKQNPVVMADKLDQRI